MKEFNPPDYYKVGKDYPLVGSRKKINLIARGIGVDSGTIAICDRKNRKNLQSYQKVFKVPNGTYYVKWVMPDTWNGVVRGSGILKITTGEVVVSDPCYLSEYEDHDEWLRFLNKYDYFKKTVPGWVILDKHGGDGEFVVEIELTKK